MFLNASNFAIYGGNFTVITNDDIHKIRQWLNAPDCSVNFATAVNNKCPGTGQWIFELDKYKEWRSNTGILWMQGTETIAGSGKTFLLHSSTTVIQNLEEMNQRSPIWYHYFDTRDNTELKTTYHGFLLSLVQQMGLSSEGIHPALNTLYKSKPFGQLTHRELENILETMIKDRNDMTIAVDALDECKEADAAKVLNWLAEFSNQLQIVVTSRHQPGLAVQNVRQVQLGDPKSGINEDIAKYIEIKIHFVKRWNSAISGEIKDKLNKGAHG
ncbi:hypothetical protein GG344DRAFT_71636, partial [Lentinula edodes]